MTLTQHQTPMDDTAADIQPIASITRTVLGPPTLHRAQIIHLDKEWSYKQMNKNFKII